MKVKPIGSNKTQVEKNGATFLVSYETVVAGLLPGKGWVRTKHFWSRTTSKHINHWLYVDNNASSVEEIPQEVLEKYFDA